MPRQYWLSSSKARWAQAAGEVECVLITHSSVTGGVKRLKESTQVALQQPLPQEPELLREGNYGTKVVVRKIIFSGPRACLRCLY